jgi:hypothetical protein
LIYRARKNWYGYPDDCRIINLMEAAKSNYLFLSAAFEEDTVCATNYFMRSLLNDLS